MAEPIFVWIITPSECQIKYLRIFAAHIDSFCAIIQIFFIDYGSSISCGNVGSLSILSIYFKAYFDVFYGSKEISLFINY